MFVGVIFALAVVCSNVDGELILEVTPEFIEPDVTPSFTLNCALLEYEEAGVISLSIHRVISPGTATTAPVTEEIASLGPFSPNLPTVSADYPQLTALGQITTFESEMGTYLKLVWPFPTVEQLGLYQCNATIIMEGAITDVSILTPVTTSNPSIDRLLKKLHDLETLVLGLNDTTVDLQAQIDNITARGAAAETTTTPVADTTSEASPSSPDKTASSTSESNEELAANVDLIVAKMEEFNQTLHQIEKRLSILELEATDIAATVDVPITRGAATIKTTEYDSTSSKSEIIDFATTAATAWEILSTTTSTTTETEAVQTATYREGATEGRKDAATTSSDPGVADEITTVPTVVTADSLTTKFATTGHSTAEIEPAADTTSKSLLAEEVVSVSEQTPATETATTQPAIPEAVPTIRSVVEFIATTAPSTLESPVVQPKSSKLRATTSEPLGTKYVITNEATTPSTTTKSSTTATEEIKITSVTEATKAEADRTAATFLTAIDITEVSTIAHEEPATTPLTRTDFTETSPLAHEETATIPMTSREPATIATRETTSVPLTTVKTLATTTEDKTTILLVSLKTSTVSAEDNTTLPQALTPASTGVAKDMTTIAKAPTKTPTITNEQTTDPPPTTTISTDAIENPLTTQADVP